MDDSPLTGKYRKPLRLFMRDGRPVTDREGYVLQNITGNKLANIDLVRNTFCDMKGLNLIDAYGRTFFDLNFDPTAIPKFEKNKDFLIKFECHNQVYDINGFPLTDKNGVPLYSRSGQSYLIFGPRGDPTSDINGRDVIDKMGVIVSRNKPLKDKKGNNLFVYDCDGRPLTDSESFPLLDITGLNLILFEDNLPHTSLSGSELYDIDGICMMENNCDFKKQPQIIKTKIKIKTFQEEPAVAFDLQGFPLTDLLGNPLCFSNGKFMITYSSSFDKWIDFNGNGAFVIPRKIYDKFTLRGFTNSIGHPIRLFDDYGRPFTDYKGVPQRHANGKLLIKFDQKGAPVSDWLDRPLYDASGVSNKSGHFRPCLPFCKFSLVEKISLASGSIQYFECTGMPLTNMLGNPLINAREEPMITFGSNGEPLCDYRKKKVFNILGLPVIGSLDLPLLGPGSVPIRLYDKEGKPLTDSTGLPLKDVRNRHMIKLNGNGLDITDGKGREVYDKFGTSAKCLIKFDASDNIKKNEKRETALTTDGEAMLLFDEEGHPLTEHSGLVLCNRLGQSLIKCPEQGFTTTLDNKLVYDVNGRKCLKTFSKHVGWSIGLYDKNSRPLTDRFGSVLRNRKGQDLVIFDKNCKPISAFVGGNLYDYKDMPLEHPLADPSHVPKTPLKKVSDDVLLYDCEDLPLTDNYGFVLHTSYGVPMVSFDLHGRVKCDHSGRPVFDVKGLAVSRTLGTWKDKWGKPYRLFDRNGFPLTDEDGRELYNIEGKSLILQDPVGLPKYTNDNDYVMDCKGRAFDDIRFKPTLFPPNAKTTLLLEANKLPLRLYDADGRPLTDIWGRTVVNSKGESLINLKNGLHRIFDWKGRQIYDNFKMPLGCTPNSPLKAMCGKPMLLYDDKGIPLTSADGMPIRKENNEVMIIFDNYGRPSATESGARLNDHAGRCSQHPQFGFIDELHRLKDQTSTSNENGQTNRPVDQ